MKYTALAIAMLSVGLTAGCSDLASLNEFVTQEEAVMDPTLVGVWTKGDSTFAVQAEGNTYSIRYFDKGPSAIRFEGRMVKVGEAKLVDLVEVSDDPFVLPVHMLARVWIEGNTLRWTFVDSEWMREETGRRFTIHKDDKRSIVTASGAEWRKAFRQLAADDKAYKGQETATKVQ